MNPSQSRRGLSSLICLSLLISPLAMINQSGLPMYSLKESLASSSNISKANASKSLEFNFFWGDNHQYSTTINGGRSKLDAHIDYSLRKKVNQKQFKIYLLEARAEVNSVSIEGTFDLDYKISSIGYISEKALEQEIRNKIHTHIIDEITK